MSTSIGDVARKAGVSMSTVSYVLNDGPRRIRPELAARVMAAVRELDYRPSRIARSMVTGRTGAIGIIHAAIRYDIWGGTFVQSALNGIAAEAQRLRHDLLLYTNALTDPAKEALADVDDGRADGWIAIAPGADDVLIDLLASLSRPMVIVCGSPRPSVPYLASDNAAGIEASVEYLLQKGHRRIGYVYGDLDLLDGRERYDAFLRVLKEHKLPFDRKWVMGGKFDAALASVWAQKILTNEYRPTALLVANDEMARNVVQCALNLGLGVPEDLSVMGFDGTVLGQLVDPPLTTVVQPLQAIGAAAVRSLDSLVRGDRASTHIRFATSLVIRASVSSPKEDSLQ